jgi:hypothetical protein
MVTARKFREMGAAEGGAQIVEAAPIDAQPRLPAPQGELDFDQADAVRRIPTKR